MALIRVEGLPASGPSEPLAAAADFYARVALLVEQAGDESLTLLFPPADHTHRGWREQAVASLARALAPRRVNGIVGTDQATIDATLAFLDTAQGVTGQLLPLDSQGAGKVIG